MAIRKFYSKTAKAGWRWDAKEEKFYSWGYDLHASRKGPRKRDNGFATKDLAAAAAARIILGEKNSKYELTDISTFPTIADLKAKRVAATRDHAEAVRSERVLQTVIDCIGNLTVNELTPVSFNSFVELRQNHGVTDATINRELRLIRAAMNQIKRFFAVPENWEPPKVNYLKVDRRRRERIVHSGEGKQILYHLLKPMEADESQRIFESRRRAGLLFLLAAITGARPGELVRLSDADILLDLDKLKITGRKTRFQTAATVRYFPLVEIVKQILKEAIEIRAGNYIFSRSGTLTDTYYGHIKTACKAAGVTYGRKVAGGFIPYDLRHTATTLLVQNGADIETISSITGQSQDSLWHYTHASHESIGRAAGILEAFGRKLLSGGLSVDNGDSARAASN